MTQTVEETDILEGLDFHPACDAKFRRPSSPVPPGCGKPATKAVTWFCCGKQSFRCDECFARGVEKAMSGMPGIKHSPCGYVFLGQYPFIDVRPI